MPKKNVSEKDIELYKNAHATINRLIDERGLKQKDLAILIDCSESTFSKKLNNRDMSHEFTLSECVTISEKFGISLNTLFGLANPVETTVPESARDTCKMFVEISESPYRFNLKGEDDGCTYMYYPEIYPEETIRAFDPVAVRPYYDERYKINDFLVKWERLYRQYASGSIDKKEYDTILHSYLDALPPKHSEKKDEHQLFIESLQESHKRRNK